MVSIPRFLRAPRRAADGTLPEKWNGLTDINTRELIALVPLAVVTIFLGIYPAPMIDLMNATVNHLVEVMKVGAQVTASMVP